jgi:hypothetical protein
MFLKNVFFLFLFLFCRNSNAQVSSGRDIKSMHPKDSTIFDFDSSFLSRVGKSPLEIFIESFSDSLNNLRKTGTFPVFLEDAQFDYKYSGWSPSHHPIPLRQMIISKVNDCQSLKMLVENKNEKYRRLPFEEDGIEVEFSNFSFHELAIKRYKEMNCSIMY